MTNQRRASGLDVLLPNIPREIMRKHEKNDPLTKEENSLLVGYVNDANDASLPVLLGIEAIGNILAYTNIKEIEEEHIHNLGWLLAHLGRQAFLLKELEASATHYMQPSTAA